LKREKPRRVAGHPANLLVAEKRSLQKDIKTQQKTKGERWRNGEDANREITG